MKIKRKRGPAIDVIEMALCGPEFPWPVEAVEAFVEFHRGTKAETWARDWRRQHEEWMKANKEQK